MFVPYLHSCEMTQHGGVCIPISKSVIKPHKGSQSCFLLILCVFNQAHPQRRVCSCGKQTKPVKQTRLTVYRHMVNAMAHQTWSKPLYLSTRALRQ